ncbi:MAG: fibronectin type III domain-containing protein [Candidatus Cryptobacteroides sp.]
MKTSIKSLFALIAGVSLFAACEKQDVKEQPSLVNITITASQDTDTKTVLGENGQVNWSLSGEKLAVWQNGTYAKSEDGVTSDGGATMKFGVTLPSGTAPYSYYAVYPNMAAYKPGETSGSSASAAKIDLRQAQYPTAESFGPSSDILVAKPVTGLSEQPAELSLQFARMVAVGKMQIKNLNSTENVTRVTFKADGKKIAGRNTMDLTKDITVAEVSGEIDPAQDNVALAYNGENIAANGMIAYFTCWPFSMTAGETFTVEVYTPSKYFTRTVTLPSDIEFKQGRATSFGVNFSGIEGVERQHFNYAKLTFDDFTKAGAKTEYSLTTVKPNGSDGPIWDCLAYKGTGIQLRDFSTVNDSYIKLPTFKDDIRTVIVTTTNGNRTICLENSAAGITKNISLTSVSGANTFDLTGKGMKTAYLRVSGGALQVSSIEVWAGEDARTQLATPSNIMADLVTGTPNSIEVVWDAVENAGSYVVTATPENGDAVSETVTEVSHTFTNLAYETEYTISVVAKPADTATHTDSEAGVCADKVTTGSKPAGGDLTPGEYDIVPTNTFWGTSQNGTQNVTANNFTLNGSSNGISLVLNNGSSTNSYVNASQTRVYNGYTLKFSVPAGYLLTSIEFTADGSNWAGSHTSDVGTMKTNKTWEGEAESVTISFKGTCRITNIKVSFKSDVPDTREPLATPVVTAQLDETNSIIVNWDAVENAGSYEVTATPANGNPVSETVTGTTHTFTGLAYNTEYTISVVAKPSDTNLYKDSEAGACTDKITTGANPNAGEELTEIIDFESSTSDYSFWTFTNMTSQQTGTITAKAGTYYGTTGGKATASISTKNIIAAPMSITFEVSKQSNNTTSSTWYVQVSSDNSTWTDVKTQSATSMTKGNWVNVTVDLSAYSNVYVRVYYSGSTAIRNIDELSFTYSE